MNIKLYCTDTSYYQSAFFGVGSGPIHIRRLDCHHSYLRIAQCSYDSNTDGESHSDDWSVRCSPGKKSSF